MLRFYRQYTKLILFQFISETHIFIYITLKYIKQKYDTKHLCYVETHLHIQNLQTLGGE